jgi:response regulator RpfG family c-di-GMP phosphodiesterase
MNTDIFKVFILEDMQLDLELNKRQVRKYNPEVLFAVARNRTEFEAKLVDFQPDIVLSDYNLPDMNGLEALLYVREHLDGTPFIFITGILNDEEKVAETILSGASGYLLKENIKKLPDLLTTVVAQNSQVMQQREQEWQRRKEHQLALQKAIGTLRNADFAGKDDVLAQLLKLTDGLA